MTTDTAIEWATKTWSPILGCARVSPGCDNCYAIRTVHRLSHNPNPKVGPLYAGLVVKEGPRLDWTGEVRVIPQRLADPFGWAKPQRVFVNSQSDLFHAEIPAEFVAEVFGVMAVLPQHTFQVLTKRQARARSMLAAPDFIRMVRASAAVARADIRGVQWPLPNLHLGVSIENDLWAARRLNALEQTPAAVPWASIEPMLGPVDLGPWLSWLKWVVIGGESGPGARPMDLRAAERLVGQCQEAGVPVFVKQLGTRQGGKGHHDIEAFPAALQVRQYPGEASDGE